MKRWLPYLLALLPGMASAAAPPPPPVEAFAELPSFESPRLSPDGKRIAAKLAFHGQQLLGVFELFDANAKPTLLNLGAVDLNDWRWVNNDWLVAQVGASAVVEAGEQWYLTRATAIERDGKKVNQLAWHDAGQNAGDILWVAGDGSPTILLAEQTGIYTNLPGFWPQVLKVDVTTGRTTQVVAAHEDVAEWYADATGVVRMGVGYSDDGRSARLLYRERDGQLFRTVDRANTNKRESLLKPSLFLKDPGKAIAIADKDGYDALYELDLKTLTLGTRLFGVTGYDVDGLVANAAGDALLGAAVTRDYARIEWLDPGFAAMQADIDKAVGADHAIIVSRSRDTGALIVKVGGADQAGAYFYYNPDSGVMHRIAWVSDTLKATRLGPVRTIHYTARDGLDIPAILTLPKDVPAHNLPLIVLPHGGPAARDEEQYDWWAQFLASRGYAVIQPNYRGSTGFGSVFLARGEGQWGLAMQDDLNDAVSWAAKQGIADPKRVCMVGGSYGGYAAMRAAQRDGALYRCAVSYAGVSDMPAILRYDRSFLAGGATGDWIRRQAPDLRAVSPVNHAADFSIPILLVHGKKDLRVPVKQSRELADKLRAAGKTFDYIEQPEADHFFSREADRLQFLKALEAFLAKYNPA